MKNSKNFAVRLSVNTVTSKSALYLLQVDTEAALIRMGKNSFRVNVRYWPFYGCVRDWVSFVSDCNPIVQFNTTVNSQEVNTVKHSYSWFSSLITKQHCLSLIWISFSHITILYLCRFSSTSFKWTAFLVHVVRISFKKFLNVGLLDLVLED